MANFKLTISDIKGKSVTKELKDSDANPLLGLEIGSEADASVAGFSGKLKITGGSDKSGGGEKEVVCLDAVNLTLFHTLLACFNIGESTVGKYYHITISDSQLLRYSILDDINRSNYFTVVSCTT